MRLSIHIVIQSFDREEQEGKECGFKNKLIHFDIRLYIAQELDYSLNKALFLKTNFTLHKKLNWESKYSEESMCR